MQPLASDAPLIVYIDVKSPYAYLALEPTRQMLLETGVLADWRPFVLDIPSYLGTAKIGPSGAVQAQRRSASQWSGVKYAYFDCRRYANLYGQTLRGTQKIWDTRLPAIGMLWIKKQFSLKAQGEPGGPLYRYLDALFELFWKRELDVEQLTVIQAALVGAGVATSGFADFATQEGARQNEQLQADAFDAGIYGVPTYILTDQGAKPARYFGREHLPRVRALLSGEAATHANSDIAYPLPRDLDRGRLEASAQAPGVAKAASGQRPRLTIWIDFSCPQSYLALLPTLSACQQGDVQIAWRVTSSKPLKKPDAASGLQQVEDRAILHRRHRAEYLITDMQRYAPHTLQRLHTRVALDAAATGLLFVQSEAPGKVNDFVERIFVRYWRDGGGIDQGDDIYPVLGELGLLGSDWRTFKRGAGPGLLEAMKQQAEALGIRSTPTYYLGDEPFQGRAHLPLLMRRLSAGI